MTEAPDHPAIKPRRSLLSVPAGNPRALAKIAALDCDGVIFDLEDSVAPAMKGEARANLSAFLREAPRDDLEAVVRINAFSSPEGRADMELVLACRPDAVLLPKVEGPADILAVEDHLRRAGAQTAPRLWAMIETPRAVLDVAAIAATAREPHSRLDCFVVGLNDLRKETGVPARASRAVLLPWLMQVVLAARAHELCVIDSVANDFRDLEAFASECLQGRDMGFDGKMLIHPAQIDAANRHFGPQAAEIAEAAAIVSAFSDPQSAGVNVINVNGRMVERLHAEEAKRLIAIADAIARRKTLEERLENP